MWSSLKAELIEILLVEDSLSDAELARESLEDGQFTHRVHVVRDGVGAMDFLHRRGKYEQAPRPQLIFLDLNLPKKNGREVLAEIKTDPQLKLIPVVVWTTSDADADILTSYELQANCYLSKPVELDRFLTLMQTIKDFWLGAVKLPPLPD